jgi:hypothetical protein
VTVVMANAMMMVAANEEVVNDEHVVNSLLNLQAFRQQMKNSLNDNHNTDQHSHKQYIDNVHYLEIYTFYNMNNGNNNQ